MICGEDVYIIVVINYIFVQIFDFIIGFITAVGVKRSTQRPKCLCEVLQEYPLACKQIHMPTHCIQYSSTESTDAIIVNPQRYSHIILPTYITDYDCVNVLKTPNVHTNVHTYVCIYVQDSYYFSLPMQNILLTLYKLLYNHWLCTFMLV